MLRENIAAYLEHNGIKQNFVAEKAGITSMAMSAIINGKRALGAEEYIRICNALNVTVDYFVDTSKTIPA